jgi:D-beta-D-heptose 7-phosphate kinase/D-beta-D-heptose 1-phosphate adenosyltransferase
MRIHNRTEQKIVTANDAVRIVNQWRNLGKTVAFTNGCFDILHEGHIASLSQAAQFADYLIVGLNSDDSVQRLKGKERPVNDQHARAVVLSSLIMVDLVVLFSEDTPLALIQAVLPDVLVKGGDYTVEKIAGAKEVLAHGGSVEIIPLVAGRSTSNIIDKLKKG